MDLRLKISMMLAFILLSSQPSQAVTRQGIFTLELSYTMNCIKVKNVRSLLHCGVLAMDSDIYGFAFTFRDGECWVCRGAGTLSVIGLSEDLQYSVYITGIYTIYGLSLSRVLSLLSNLRYNTHPIPKVHVSRLVLQLSLCNLLKPCVKLRMKM